MAGEITSAGIKFCYKAETNAGTKPTGAFTEIPDVISLPAMDSYLQTSARTAVLICEVS